MGAFVARLTGGAVELGPWGRLGFDPLAVPVAAWAAALAAYLVVLFVCEWFQYYYQYGVIYKESGRQRIALAERLRKLPLSFFGRRDLADLTETLMSDVKTIEHAYSHVLPELYGAYATWPSPSRACSPSTGGWPSRRCGRGRWRCSCCSACAPSSRRSCAATRMEGLAVSEVIQEALECVREVRATNQEERYLERHLRERGRGRAAVPCAPS